jgi:hypothetical protein
MWFLIGLRRLLTRSQAAVVLGGFSQPGCVTHRRQAEEPLVLAAEVRGVLMTKTSARFRLSSRPAI